MTPDPRDVELALGAYMECALWASTDRTPNETEPTATPVPLDTLATVDDFAPETVETMRADVARFLGLPAVQSALDPLTTIRGGWSLPEQVGHDLWLTRNGHGAGFWDRDDDAGFSQAYRDLANLVGWDGTEDFKESDLYVGDDGKVYVS